MPGTKLSHRYLLTILRVWTRLNQPMKQRYTLNRYTTSSTWFHNILLCSTSTHSRLINVYDFQYSNHDPMIMTEEDFLHFFFPFSPRKHNIRMTNNFIKVGLKLNKWNHCDGKALWLDELPTYLDLFHTNWT